MDESGRTVFVRGLPFTLSDSQLEEIFSEVGPVRRAFTVKDKETGKHRGIGFVEFAISEHAKEAISTKNQSSVEGRKINVELAKRRAPLSERIKKKKAAGNEESVEKGSGKMPHPEEHEKLEEGGTKKKRQKTGPSEDVDHGVTTDGSKKKPKKKPKKGPEATQIDAPSQKQRVARTVVIGCLNNPQTTEAVLALAKKLGTVESIQDQLSQADLNSHDLARDGCKLPAAAIVFNSVRAAREAVHAFHRQRIGDADVWARQMGGEGSKLKRYRLIVRNLPFNVSEAKLKEVFSAAGFVWEITVPRKENGQSKGFGFIGYTTKTDAEKAVETLNGTKIFKRPVAVDWTVPKSEYESITKKSTDNENDEDTASESEDEKHEKIREVAADDRSDEDDDDDEKKPLVSSDDVDLLQRVLNKVVSQEAPESENVKEKPSTSTTSKKEPTTLKKEPTTSPREKKAEDTQAAEDKDDNPMERTLFVRNLPIDLEVVDLKPRFASFGVVKSLRLVRHPVTKKPKGTAFLEFETREEAEAAVKAAEGAEAGKSSFLVGGKQVILHFAVDKDSARHISKQKSIEQEDGDRRNLHLVAEGFIQQGTAAARGVSEADLAKRKALQAEKATKLRSPNFHVSQTRLAFHNFPKSKTEKDVKRMFIDAVKSRATKQIPHIKQVKILRDESEGSRGSGFVEFTEHQHALVALRVLNNNPTTFTSEKRPIVEFAIENMQKLRQREHKMEAMKKRELEGKKLGRGKGDDEKLDGNRKRKRGAEDSVVPEEKFSNKKRKRGADDEVKVDDSGKKSNKKRRKGNVDDDAKTGDQSRKQRFKKEAVPAKMENTKKRPLDESAKPAASPGKLKKNIKVEKPKGRRGQRGKVMEDKLDKLVSEYRSKYFSGGSSSKAVEAPQRAAAAESIKRWFE